VAGIGEQGERQVVLVAEPCQGGRVVGADADDPVSGRHEGIVPIPEIAGLAGAPGGERFRVEEDHQALACEVGEAYLRAVVAGEVEIGGGVADLDGHGVLLARGAGAYLGGHTYPGPCLPGGHGRPGQGGSGGAFVPAGTQLAAGGIDIPAPGVPQRDVGSGLLDLRYERLDGAGPRRAVS